jgi:hypothetical protein
MVLLFLIFTACQKAPVRCSRRASYVGQGYVVKVENKTDKTVSLWFKTDEKKAYFTLGSYESKEFGWLEGFHIGANTSFTVGGEGYFPMTYSDATN